MTVASVIDSVGPLDRVSFFSDRDQIKAIQRRQKKTWSCQIELQ
jgi:hypothetical protein